MRDMNSGESGSQLTEEARLQRALLRLNAKVLGLVLGLTFGLMIFIMTNWLILAGGHVDETGKHVVGPHLALLGQFFLGYRVSFVGSLFGFVYGFALGSISGALLSILYNKLSHLRSLINIGSKRPQAGE